MVSKRHSLIKRRRSSSAGGGSRRSSSASFQMFTALEAKEEFQKVKLAGFLRELHDLAREEHKGKLLEKVSSGCDDDNNNKTTDNGEVTASDGKVSLRDVDLDSMTPAEAQCRIDMLKGGEKLDSDSFLLLCKAVADILKREQTVLDLREIDGADKVTVVGDLHGSLNCCCKVLEALGDVGGDDEESRIVVFDGDYVDRGTRSLEVFSILLLLKVAHRHRVFLLRGNHEDMMIASVYGFREELEEKYDYDKAQILWKECSSFFAALPVVARTKTAVIVHGGIPAKDFSLSQLEDISPETRCKFTTVVNPEDDLEELIEGIMWSDPSPYDGIEPSPRGTGVEFGPDVARDFLDRHDARYLIRAHEPVEEGAELLDVGGGKGVVTVFSTANYPHGEGTNMAAVIHLDSDGYETVSFSFQDAEDSHNDIQVAQYDNVLRLCVTDNRTRLTKAFRSEEEENGTVTISQWIKVVAEQLEMPAVPWKELQPGLAPATEPNGGRIDWKSFLDKYSPQILPRFDQMDENQLAILHEQQDKLLGIFKLLDTDGNGTISRTEFVCGIEDLNKNHLPPDKQFQCAFSLFDAIDSDENGEVSIDEFSRAMLYSSRLRGVTGALDTERVESLQQNHEMLLVAFKYLDTDKSGAIDRKEFQTGVDLLNKRLPEKKRFDDPDELFDLIDLDGSGEIDLDEFRLMFQGV